MSEEKFSDQTTTFLTSSQTGLCYELVSKLGNGSYGAVYLGKETTTKKQYAVKATYIKENQGIPISSLREIKASKELLHENIVVLVDNFIEKNFLYLVYTYCPHDLYGINLSEDVRFSEPQIKSFMKQIIEGIQQFHSKGYVHRDLKTSNILLDSDGTVKIIDFGLSKELRKDGYLTNNVVTRWYRCPELLLGSTKYGPEVDMWSIGCILAEFMQRAALFTGKDDFDQLRVIVDICGTPKDETLWNVQIKQKKQNILRQKFQDFPEEVLDLLEKLLDYDPKKRISASDALKHEWFLTEPLAKKVSENIPRNPRNEQWLKLRVERIRENMKKKGVQKPIHKSKMLKKPSEIIEKVTAGKIK